MSAALPPELLQGLSALNPLQLAWLSGYCWAQANGAALPAPAAAVAAATPAAEPLRITVLSASQTGNARKVAATLAERLQAAGLNAQHIGAADYKPRQLASEQLLLLVASTQGEGEPAEEAVSLHKFLHGKKPPALGQLHFAVLGLGDSSYPHFCQSAKDFDERLAQLGGTRLADRQDCDLDFQASADQWLARIVPLVQQHAQAHAQAHTPAQPAAATPAPAFHRDAPFAAPLLTCQKITGRHSDKDVRHIELDLSGSGLSYQPGDALGVWFDNDEALVTQLLTDLQLDGSEPVEIKGQTKPLRQALLHDLDITQNTPQFVRGYAELTGNAELLAAVNADPHAYAAAHPLAGIVHRHPIKLTAAQLIGLLRPLTPRLYSIASAPEESGDEVHLSVGVLRYTYDGQPYTGGASGYLAQGVPEGGSVRVFVEPNPHFRLPQDPRTPIVMIGSGTGIAPFRAFVQQRAATQAPGRNWLIFGNPHFAEDFLYQTEWQSLAKQGYLHAYHFAWSRDQAHKVYVQHKLRENAAQLWQWLQDGAHVYVCGDATRMARDVQDALLHVIATQGGMSADAAEDYLDELRQNKRYQRDVY